MSVSPQGSMRALGAAMSAVLLWGAPGTVEGAEVENSRAALSVADLWTVLSAESASVPTPDRYLVDQLYDDALYDTPYDVLDLYGVRLRVPRDDPSTPFDDASALVVDGSPRFYPPNRSARMEVALDTNYDAVDDYLIGNQILNGSLVQDVTPIHRVLDGLEVDTGQVAVWKVVGMRASGGGLLVAADRHALSAASVRVTMMLTDDQGNFDRAPDGYQGLLVQMPTAPSAPVNAAASAGDRSATVSWSAPVQTGTHAITWYVVTAHPGGATCASATTSCVVPGLVNGQSYAFAVVATSAAGVSPASVASAPVTPKPYVRVKVRARRSANVLFIDVNPNKGRGYWRFRVEKWVGAQGWVRRGTYRTWGSKETRTLNLKKGTYRVVVHAKYGYQGATSSSVSLRR